jgi:hypothetical protein
MGRIVFLFLKMILRALNGEERMIVMKTMMSEEDVVVVDCIIYVDALVSDGIVGLALYHE